MASTKLVAVFLMCILVLAVVHVSEAHDYKADYHNCYKDCEKKCEGEGNGYSFCEMKCDTDCAKEEIKADLQDMIHPHN